MMHITVMSYEHNGHGIWHLFVQQFVQADTKENTKAVYYCHFVRVSHWWLVVSHHRGPVMQKVFPCHDDIMNIEYPSNTYFKLKSSEILYTQNLVFCCSNIFQWCTEHGGDAKWLIAPHVKGYVWLLIQLIISVDLC